MLKKDELISWLAKQGDRTFPEKGDVCGTCVITMFFREEKAFPDARTGSLYAYDRKDLYVAFPAWAKTFVLTFDEKAGEARTATYALELLQNGLE